MDKNFEELDSLDRVLHDTWEMLQRGAGESNDPFHWPVLGTVGENSCNLRTVILRQFSRSERLLVCHTDIRAAKVREIQDNNLVAWLFYHPKKKIQLRVSGSAQLHTSDRFADDQWRATSVITRLNFCTVESPGTPIDQPSSGLPHLLLDKAPALIDSERGRDNFLSISCRIDSIDWLVLGTLGNRRARFEWLEDELSATWLVP
jgi:hypothetical protein